LRHKNRHTGGYGDGCLYSVYRRQGGKHPHATERDSTAVDYFQRCLGLKPAYELKKIVKRFFL